MDDRYFVFFFLPDYLLSINRPTPPPADGAARGDRGFKIFVNSGIAIRETKSYYFVANLKKGCPYQLFDRKARTLVHSGLGYMYESAGGIRATTMGFGQSRYAVEDKDGHTVICHEASFPVWDVINPLRRLFIFFRLFNYTLERFATIHRIFGSYLKMKKIKKSRVASGRLRRTISLSTGEVKISDEVDSGNWHTSSVYESPA